MKKTVKGKDIEFFLLTNILTESSEVIFAGEGGRKIMEDSFCGTIEKDWMFIAGMVSRKKQFVPKVLNMVQQ